MRKLYLSSIALLLLVYTCKSAPNGRIINKSEDDNLIICEKCEDCEASNLKTSDNDNHDSKKSETVNCKSCGIAINDQRKVMKGCTETLKEQQNLKLIYSCNDSDNCNNIEKNKCYKCSSKEDHVNCVGVTSSTETENCSNLSTKCFTKLDEKGYTVRGCAPSDFKCDSESCFECDGFKCNKIIKKDHRQCYHCNGQDCLTVNEKQKHYCSKYMKDDECYTDVLTENDANRGCLSDLNDDQKSENILKCKSNNCNEKKAIESVIQCVECTENDGEDCLRSENSNDPEKCEIDSSKLKECTIKKLLNHKNKKQCYTSYKNGKVERGCEEVDINNHDKEYCINDAMCNKKCTPLMCYTCDSKIDKYCKNDITKLKPSDCEKDTCYSCTDKDGNTFRGCGKKEDKNMTCKQCSSPNKCNTDNPEKPPAAENIMCYSCDSKDDPNCAQVNNLSEIEKVKCEKSCVIKIKDGNTLRGCLSETLSCDPEKENCMTCNLNNLCNGEVFPKNRLKCHHCDGKNKICNEERKSENVLPCKNYNSKDSCYAYASTSNEMKMYRGCSSDPQFKSCKEAGTKMCKTCDDSEGCNSFPLKTKAKLSCIKCEKDDIACAWGYDANKKTSCNGEHFYYLKESCFVKKFDKNEVQRGCSLENADVCKEGSANCALCSKDGCNNENVITQSCLQCDSKITDQTKKCTSAKDIMATTCPGIIPFEYRGCYTKREGKDVIRNCAIKLGENFENCKNEKDKKKCEICDDDGCNNKSDTDDPEKPPAPENIMCYSCDSKDDPNCAQVNNLSEIGRVKCEKSCVIKIKDGNTLRGCLSETLPCDPEKENCMTCNLNLCNGEVFPKNRLKCHHCDGKNKICNEEQKSENVLPCKNYNSKDSCYAYASTSNEMKMYRGCSSDPQFKSCKEAGTKMCKTCDDSEGCNSFPLKTKAKLSCIKCEKDDIACAWGYDANKKTSCNGEHFYYLKESCFVKKFDKNEVQRGCSLENADVCKEGSANCALCSKDGCNNENVITQSCLQCDSKITDQTKKCTSAKDIMATTCPGIIPFEYRGCYTKREGKDVIRNCAIKLGENFENCKNEKDKKKCEICDEDGCNNKPNTDNPEKPPAPENIMCYSCDSKDDPNCAQVNNLSEIGRVKCEKSCVIKIKDGNTLRGCLSETLPCDPEKENCMTCNLNLCNGEVFPKNRLKCHHCDGKNKICNEEQKSENVLPCKNYNSKDSCYAYASTSNEMKMYRGCSSDPQFKSCKEAGTKMCKTCDDSEGCNSFPLKTKAKLSCIKCEKDDIACAWGYDANKKTSCNGEHFYYLEESCFVKKFDKNEVQRGCSLENTDVCKEGSANCALCSKDGCNNENVITQSCLQCDSKITDQTKKCTSAKDIMATTCPGIIPFEYRGCYTKREGKDVIRNCAIKLGENFENCKNEKDKKKCEICDEDGCNNKPNTDNPEKPPAPENIMCYSCDSKDDPNCAQVNNLSEIGRVKCEKSCVIKIKDGNTLRGCLSETLPCDPEKENCMTCNLNLCNGEVFPKNRLKCHHCDGKNKICNEEQKSENVLPCKNYNSKDSCYAYASTSNEMKMYRGCSSDPQFKSCKEAGTKMCKTCDDSEGCNSFPLKTKAKLSCIKCEKDDIACAWGYDANKKTSCNGEHFYYLEESCFVKKFDKNEVQRGCSLENADVCKEGSANCTLCSNDGCNNENVITQSCLQCDSKIPDQTKKCTSAKDIMATTCPGIIPFEYRGCYTKREGKDVIRNCAIKLGENFENCKNEKDKKKCELCEKDGCNSGNMFSVASITVLVSVMIHIFQ